MFTVYRSQLTCGKFQPCLFCRSMDVQEQSRIVHFIGRNFLPPGIIGNMKASLLNSDRTAEAMRRWGRQKKQQPLPGLISLLPFPGPKTQKYLAKGICFPLGPSHHIFNFKRHFHRWDIRVSGKWHMTNLCHAALHNDIRSLGEVSQAHWPRHELRAKQLRKEHKDKSGGRCIDPAMRGITVAISVSHIPM